MEEPKNLILKCVAGSHLYGLNTPSSDMDIRGIYLDDIADALNVVGRQNTESSDDKQDEKYYSLGKFLKLASECNPNIIELLYLPEDAVLYRLPIYDELIKHRDWFMSKRAMHTFKGYAYAQIQRAKGLNKKGNSVSKYINDTGVKILRMFLNQPFSGKTRMPDSELNANAIRHAFGGDFLKWLKKETVEYDDHWLRTLPHHHPPVPPQLAGFLWSLEDDSVKSMLPPRMGDFVFWYRTDENGFPFRQVRFAGNPGHYDASRVEGCGDLYRLYRNGEGFFDESTMNVIVRSISEEREREDFVGVVRINLQEYQKAKREYDSFWEWMANRNESRYTNDWDSEGKVDWKNLMHTMRLLLCANSIAESGIPKVRFDGEERDYLMKIRNGEFSYNEILEKATAMMNDLDEAFGKSDLPYSSDIKKINSFYMETMKKQLLEETE